VGSPPRDATDHYLECMNRQLNIVFGVGLGELTRWAVMITAG
jgi:hypothetical protein